MANKNRRSRRAAFAVSQRAAVGVVLLVGSFFQASAEPYDFLFTPSAAVFLDNGSTIAPGDRLNRPAIASLFPNHTIEEGVEEASTVWYVFLQRDPDGYAADGITIYMEWDDPETVHFVAGYRGVIDAAGATIGTPLTDLYPSGFAKCDAGLWYGAVAKLVGIEGGVVSGCFNPNESNSALDRRPRHDEHYHEARCRSA